MLVSFVWILHKKFFFYAQEFAKQINTEWIEGSMVKCFKAFTGYGIACGYGNFEKKIFKNKFKENFPVSSEIEILFCNLMDEQV